MFPIIVAYEVKYAPAPSSQLMHQEYNSDQWTQLLFSGNKPTALLDNLQRLFLKHV